VPDFLAETPRPLVQWINANTAPLARDLDLGGPIGAVALSIHGAGYLAKTLEVVHEIGLGVVVETEAWRAQLDPEDPRRTKHFARHGLDPRSGKEFRPSEARLNQADHGEIAAAHRDVQVGAGATMLTSPCHRVREPVPLGPGRRLDLALAHEFVALARASAADRPSPQEGLQRRVAASLAVDAQKLTDALLVDLVAAYSEVDADIFWIWIWNFRPSGRQYTRVRSLAQHLQTASGKPCIVGGLGRLAEPALRNQVSAVCQGWGRNELPFPPPDPPEPRSATEGDEEEEENGRGIHVFHPAIRGTTSLGEKAEAPLRALFRLEPCPCGHHRPDEVPVGQRARHFHNRYWAERLAAAAVALEPTEATAELVEIVAAAEGSRAENGLKKLKPAWRSATEDESLIPRVELPADIWRRSA
jgi:hypothetical protein